MLNLTDQSSSDPSREHLEASIEELEEAAASGRLNTLCLRALAGAARLLGHNEIAERADRLLRETPDEAFWAGAITNIDITEEATNRLRTIEPIEELERRHPRYSVEKIVQRISSNSEGDEHLALCLEGRVEEARAMAGSGVRLEEVGSLLAVLGDFDSARSISVDPALEPFRQKGVKFVLLIELFRRGRVEETAEMLDEMTSGGCETWSRIQLALAFADRVPWGGYPFPDW